MKAAGGEKDKMMRMGTLLRGDERSPRGWEGERVSVVRTLQTRRKETRE